MSTLKTSDLTVYDGEGRRSKLNDCIVSIVTGTEVVNITTDSDGDLADVTLTNEPGIITLSFGKAGYKSIKTKTRVTWANNIGTLGLVCVHMLT